MTTKSGLSKNIKNLINKDIDPDVFFPRCFNLFDYNEFEDFLGNFYKF